MKRVVVILAIVGPLITGLAITSSTLTHKTFAHISVLNQKYSALDSVYIDSRGFPCAMWARNDPVVSGVGDAEEAIIWWGVRTNALIWSGILYVVEVTGLAVLALVMRFRNRRRAPTIASSVFRTRGTPPAGQESRRSPKSTEA